MSARIPAGLALAFLAPTATASDLLVDASGAPGTHPTVAAAMAAASLGDRILVAPGTYPAFHYTKGVPVIGLGASPADVKIARCDFHPNLPNDNFDALLKNLTLGSDSDFDAIALSGNELSSGVLVLDGVVVSGGAFLGGGPGGFYLSISNSRVEPGPGEGFANSAVYVGGVGNTVDVQRSLIRGWDASDAFGAAAGVGIKVRPGTLLRISKSEVYGGSGTDPAGALAAGASAIAMGLGSGGASVRIAGGTMVLGGAGIGAGPGGHGVDVNGAIEWHGSSVDGGVGSPHGLPFAGAQPVLLSVPLNLDVQPALLHAQVTGVHTGDGVVISMATPGVQSFLALSLSLDPPPPGFATPMPLASSLILAGGSFAGVVPPSGAGTPIPGLVLHAQGAYFDFATGSILLTEGGSIGVDLD